MIAVGQSRGNPLASPGLRPTLRILRTGLLTILKSSSENDNWKMASVVTNLIFSAAGIFPMHRIGEISQEMSKNWHCTISDNCPG